MENKIKLKPIAYLVKYRVGRYTPRVVIIDPGGVGEEGSKNDCS